MKDSKNLVIGMLCAVVCIMAVVYAAFSTQLSVNGTASIESSWDVHIKDITCTPKHATGATSGALATGTKVNQTTASFTMSFTQPGDSATCVVNYENTGSLDATLTHVVTGAEGSEAIKIDLVNTDQVQTLAKTSGTAQVSFTATYLDVLDENDNSVSSKDETVTLTIASTAVQAGLSN